jgi:hypothetical protein
MIQRRTPPTDTLSRTTTTGSDGTDGHISQMSWLSQRTYRRTRRTHKPTDTTGGIYTPSRSGLDGLPRPSCGSEPPKSPFRRA